ncbi:MAG: hypothetical protein QW705_04590 [Zestosphaera sp.]
MEVRSDALSSRVTAISRLRKYRPRDVGSAGSECPFCPGREYSTPPATLVVKLREGKVAILKDTAGERVKGWSVRIFPNLYPAFSTEGSGLDYGYHEVVVETPEHQTELHSMRCEQLGLALHASFLRLREIYSDNRVVHGLIFRNYGAGGGRSLTHPHTQLVATSFVLPEVMAEVERAEKHYVRSGRCLYCSMIEEEMKSERLIHAGGGFAVIASRAPRTPYEALVVPVTHTPSPLDLQLSDAVELARVLQALMRAYRSVLGDVGYNMWVHLPPKGTGANSYHWHVEVLPTTSVWGGLEKGGGVYIVDTSPEEAAAELRKYFAVT